MSVSDLSLSDFFGVLSLSFSAEVPFSVSSGVVDSAVVVSASDSVTVGACVNVSTGGTVVSGS